MNASSPNLPDHPYPDVERLRADLDLLIGALVTWADRDDTQVQPEVTQAGLDAAAALDRIITGVMQLRDRLTDELVLRHEAAEARWRNEHPRWRDSGSGPGWPLGDPTGGSNEFDNETGDDR